MAIGATRISALVAHVLAWAAGVWFVFGPLYVGESVTPTLPGQAGGEATQLSATAVEANGLSIIWLLLMPILLTGIGLLAIQLTYKRRTSRRVLLWGIVAVLLGFCMVAIFSIGVFYLPAAFALLVAAATDSVDQATDEEKTR